MTLKRLRERDAAAVLRAAMCAFTAAYLLAALLAPDRADMFAGFGRILTGSAQLTKDYFKPELGSVSGVRPEQAERITPIESFRVRERKGQRLLIDMDGVSAWITLRSREGAGANE